MAFIYDIYFEIFLCVLCLNSGVLLVDALVDTPIKTPFDTSKNVTATTQPNILNSTNPSSLTLVKNVTTNVANDTTHSILNPIQDFFFYPLNLLWTFVKFLTGGFIFDVLRIFGLPNIFIYIMQGIIGLLMVPWVIHQITGR